MNTTLRDALQAARMGLVVHAMGGFDRAAAPGARAEALQRLN